MESTGYYVHSGRFDARLAALGVLSGAAMAAALGAVYAGMLHLSGLLGAIPVVGQVAGGFDPLMAIGYGMLLAFATASLIRWLHVRSAVVCAFTVATVALVGLWASWVVWVKLCLWLAEGPGVGIGSLLVQPALLWSWIVRINDVGAWSINGWTPTGAVLWAVWAVEAGIVLGGAIFGAIATFADVPFCEDCSTWCEKHEHVCITAAGDDAALTESLEQRRLSHVEELGAPESPMTTWYAFDVETCPVCGELNTLDVARVVASIDSDGDVSLERTEVIENLLLTRAEAQQLRGIGVRLAGSRSATAGGGESADASEAGSDGRDDSLAWAGG